MERCASFTVRFLCAVLFPSRSWIGAQVGAAEVVKMHCRALARRQLIAEVNENLYTLACLGNA